MNAKLLALKHLTVVKHTKNNSKQRVQSQMGVFYVYICIYIYLYLIIFVYMCAWASTATSPGWELLMLGAECVLFK